MSIYSVKNEKAFKFGMRVGKIYIDEWFKKYPDLASDTKGLDLAVAAWNRSYGLAAGKTLKNIIEMLMNDYDNIPTSGKIDNFALGTPEYIFLRDMYHGFVMGELLGNPTVSNLGKASETLESKFKTA